MRGTGSAALLWAVPAALTFHNVEEAVGSRFFDADSALAAAWRRAWSSGPEGFPTFELTLAALTLAAVLIAGLGDLAGPRSRAARALVVIQAGMLVNAFWHVAAAILLGGYAPGVLTAVLVEAPASRVVLGRNRRERWLSSRAVLVTVLIVAALHAVPALVATRIIAGGRGG